MSGLGNYGHWALGSGADMSTSLPLVTVITPAYNVGAFVGEAVDSVLAQSFTNFEYIVVDDGSVDETVAEVERRAQRDKRVRLIKSEHGGGPHARNLGIKEAQGKFIAFLDGDDRWHSQFLEKQLALIESVGTDVAAVFCRARVMSEGGRVYLLRWQRGGMYDFDAMLVQSCPPRVGSSLLIKKQAFDQAGLFDVEVRSAQDLDMWLRIQRDSGMPYFYGNPAYLVDIRVRPGAISRDHTKRFNALQGLIDEYGPDMKHEPLGMAYVRAAVFAFRAGDETFALDWAAKARTAGLRKLISDGYGRRVLFWSSLSERQRMIMRRTTNQLRGLVGRIVGSTSGLAR